MSKLKERLSAEMKGAMKAGDKQKLGFVRNLHAAVRKKEIDDRKDLDDAGVQKIAATLIKQRQESITQFKKGGRDDLVAAEEAELKFLQDYVPEQMGDDELKKLIDEALAESGAKEMKELGKVMKVLMPKIQGRADGKKVNQFVREKLQG